MMNTFPFVWISLWYPQAAGTRHYIPRCLLCTSEPTGGLFNPKKSKSTRVLCLCLCAVHWDCIQRTDPLDVQVSTSVPVGSSRPCSAIPNFSFMDLQDPLELLPGLWWSSQTRSCPGSSSPCCDSVRVTWDLAQKMDRVALVWMWPGVDHQYSQ